MNREQRRQFEKNLKKKAGKRMKKYNLTDKLNFEENPKIAIKDFEVEVITNAKVVMKAASAMDENDNIYTAINEAYELLFSEADRKKIDKLDLNLTDFVSLVDTAVALAVGSDPDEKGNE